MIWEKIDVQARGCFSIPISLDKCYHYSVQFANYLKQFKKNCDCENVSEIQILANQIYDQIENKSCVIWKL